MISSLNTSNITYLVHLKLSLFSGTFPPLSVSVQNLIGGMEADTKSDHELSDEMEDADLKIILLGDSAVGKSKLIERYLMSKYEPRQLSTYALTVYRHEMDIDGKTVTIDFWDTAGQERFNSMHPAYYFKAHAAILVFDVSRKLTYQNLNGWHKELLQYRQAIPLIVCANKIDINYNVTKKKFAFATKRKLPLEFVSAADGTNVVKVFQDAISMANQYRNAPKKDFKDEILEIADSLN